MSKPFRRMEQLLADVTVSNSRKKIVLSLVSNIAYEYDSSALIGGDPCFSFVFKDCQNFMSTMKDSDFESSDTLYLTRIAHLILNEVLYDVVTSTRFYHVVTPSMGLQPTAKYLRVKEMYTMNLNWAVENGYMTKEEKHDTLRAVELTICRTLLANRQW